MLRALYSLFFYLALPFILLRLWWRGRLAPDYRLRWLERFGFFAAPARTGGIWVHVVSVGETIAAAPMIKQLMQLYPQVPICITSMTPTGSERVKAIFGDSVFHVYVPYDVPDAVSRFLARVKPQLAIMMETEVWPNVVYGCAAKQVPVVIVNARLSARSARGYARVFPLAKAVFKKVSLIVAQTQADARRFQFLGMPPEKLVVSGSVKFDVTLPDVLQEQAANLRQTIGERLVWIAASTHPGEDEIVLAAHRQLLIMFPSLLLVLVPRHKERFDAVESMVIKQGLQCARRSRHDLSEQSQVLLGDSIGELLMLFGLADIAFVGGSLVERGGHNMLEAAVWKLPILTGDSDFNFKVISDLLSKKGALLKCADTAELVSALEALILQPALREQRGAAALSVVEANRGALSKLLAAVEPFCPKV